ncbi:hypothetical protein GGX14DRAFT_577006 [Mycena pura]|uniref:Uncharacterized protein n=1 Tax=Mycena pura TaxID=153505 RepID=A0AAD6Y6N7_9AGAR|nr:hypothetical protein GGX14DRAFT_577006 [Mycena pura]
MAANEQDFIADVQAPPGPAIVLLAHTSLADPIFPTLLMHEDPELGPPLAKGKKVSFKPLKPLEPASPPPVYPPKKRTRATINAQASDTRIPPFPIDCPDGGASRVHANVLRLKLTTANIDAEADLAEKRLNKQCSLKNQDRDRLQEVRDKVIAAYPNIDFFVDRWPTETILINHCKSSKAGEQATLAREQDKALEALAKIQDQTFHNLLEKRASRSKPTRRI